MTTIAIDIARSARLALGRPASHRKGVDWGVDWAAVWAVRDAALAAGMTHALEAWVPRGGGSLRRLAQAYCTRYAQAYGPGPWGHDAAGALASLRAVGAC